jgi:hypothetical protein
LLRKKRKEAEDLEVQVMETRLRVLGEEHPDTLAAWPTSRRRTGIKGDGRKRKSWRCK